MLTCGFGSHRAPCTVAQRSNRTIAAAHDGMAGRCGWVTVSAQLTASGRGCIRPRVLSPSALLSSADYGSSIEQGGGVQVFWRVHMRAADASPERRASVVNFGVAHAIAKGEAAQLRWLRGEAMQTLAQLQRRRQPGLRLLWTAIQPAAAADAPQLTQPQTPVRVEHGRTAACRPPTRPCSGGWGGAARPRRPGGPAGRAPSDGLGGPGPPTRAGAARPGLARLVAARRR